VTGSETLSHKCHTEEAEIVRGPAFCVLTPQQGLQIWKKQFTQSHRKRDNKLLLAKRFAPTVFYKCRIRERISLRAKGNAGFSRDFPPQFWWQIPGRRRCTETVTVSSASGNFVSAASGWWVHIVAYHIQDIWNKSSHYYTWGQQSHITETIFKSMKTCAMNIHNCP